MAGRRIFNESSGAEERSSGSLMFHRSVGASPPRSSEEKPPRPAGVAHAAFRNSVAALVRARIKQPDRSQDAA